MTVGIHSSGGHIKNRVFEAGILIKFTGYGKAWLFI